jgi:hypothetical protein
MKGAGGGVPTPNFYQNRCVSVTVRSLVSVLSACINEDTVFVLFNGLRLVQCCRFGMMKGP